MFPKILIATRGEAVLRIARTCERMGIVTVAIHSEREAQAPHVTTCDEAVCVGGPAPRDSYANVAAIVAAAQRAGAAAVHPGWGALAHNAAFARAVTEAGLSFIGAAPEILERFTDAPSGREVAVQAGVRVLPHARIVPGGPSALELARELGFPLLVRSSALDAVSERVEDEHELAQAVGLCRDRAMAASPDARIHLEPFLDRPRMLSVLLMADGRGECIPLGEFERCTERPLGARILVDELPAPALVALPNGGLKRRILWDAAARVANEGGLSGPGTADFLLDSEARLFFTRLRPGLPPEHALVEMCTGLDVVEAQLRIAAGEAMPDEVRNAQPSGNVMQARLWAGPQDESAQNERGELSALRWPMLAPGTLRIETDLGIGLRPGVEYDPVVARVVAYGQTRHQALLTLDRALAEATIEPLATNLDLVRQVLGDESYRAGQYDAEFVERLAQGLRDSP
jgi:3-methylcrotonyl-CoA carboxylase alpha subunit